MTRKAFRLTCFALFAATLAITGAHAQTGNNPQIDWGDDTSKWAGDGECDDPRFAGEGMAALTEDADLFRDAADCESLFRAGRISLARADLAVRPAAAPVAATEVEPEAEIVSEPAIAVVAEPAPVVEAAPAAPAVPFGNDSSEWANDGECDDPRFSGEGMASGSLSYENAYSDRTDCQRYWEAGTLTYDGNWRADLPPPPTAAEIDAVDFGSDSSGVSGNGACNDPRFEGVGMAHDVVADTIRADASDCRYLFMTGAIRIRQK